MVERRFEFGRRRRNEPLDFRRAARRLPIEEPMAPDLGAIDPDIASEEEIFMGVGPDPFAVTPPEEQLCLCEPFGRRF